ncbi:MAG: glycogen debranching protein GlgX [Ilumatobacter sp.]|uniref:glycogen debranching protein GlgX n=1 Tax=Ilumatobacter sp. TaxID=1967498 RepID=UPI002628464B|nr:glycogen debranching protein GlgX [Ilumatobacter sp.]MDJ0770013.1 glycogen debranching protein GlgX [Ilumatobacter sp.]
MSSDAQQTSHRQWVGAPYPLGASYDGTGTNFSIFSSVAEGVELCLLGDTTPDGRRDEVRVEVNEVDGHIWHVYLPDVRPGQHYGWRVHGPWDPALGLWCNASKLLLDPYAKTIEGEVDWSPACFGYEFADHDKPNVDDSAPHVPLAVVSDPYFEWGNDRPPNTPMHETVIYEAHVKGMTMRHPGVPDELRGTYSGIAHPAVIEHLVDLGVTAIELMPVHQFVHDHRLVELGLRNYWGYNSIAYLSPHNDYASRDVLGQVQEFKAMVKALHSSGIEVILDVVYNHTAEGNHLGPTLSMRGIDNQAYYRLVDGDARHYLDFTGTGNSMNMRHPHVLQLIMDSLRYWHLEMHVDGFRFDLASALARELYEVDRLSAFFDIVQQDPLISQVKLIAEPWDVGEGGYQVGKFPPHWSEWNGKYRDTIRDFWRGEPATLAEFGYRFTGSSDLYEADTRKPMASVNFVTCHDGFTLNDLVSYNEKHNEANGEANQDGESHNRSWNHGVEGPTDDPEILELRARQRRNFIATLLLSQGVPMLSGGDEIGRTQDGNNNAYCQDSELSWHDWDNVDDELHEWVKRLVGIQRDHPVFRRRRWFQGHQIRGIDDMAWLRPDGEEMNDDDWESGHAKSVGVFINGQAIRARDPFGGRIVDDTFLVLFNASEIDLEWQLPDARWAEHWIVEVDSADPDAGTPERPSHYCAAGSAIDVTSRSLVLLRQTDDVPVPTHPAAGRTGGSTA